MGKVRSEDLRLSKKRPGAHGEFPVECYCTRCRKTHMRNIHWVGRGTPKFFCKACRKVAQDVGSSGFRNPTGAPYTGSSCKKGGAE